jgi:hypothetical protein
VTDDEIWCRPGAQRVLRGRGQCEENGLFAPSLVDGGGSLSRHDNPGGSAAEQAAHILEAFGAGHEDALAFAQS